MDVFQFNTVIHVFLLSWLCIFIVCLRYVPSSCQLSLFGYPDFGFSMFFPQF